METITIVIPKYIREVQVSDKQRPSYWEYDGIYIRSKKGRKPLVKMIHDTARYKEDDKLKLDNLSDNYLVGIFIKNVLTATLSRRDIQMSISDLVNIFTDKGYKPHELTGMKLHVIDIVTKEKVIANLNQVGKPNIIKIRGQDIYAGSEFIRMQIMSAIKDNLREVMKHVEPISFDKYPLAIEVEVHHPISDGKNSTWDVDNHSYPYLKAIPDVLQELGVIPNDDRLHITIPPYAVLCPIENVEDRKLVVKITSDRREIIINNINYATNIPHSIR